MSPRPSVEEQRREDVLEATWELIIEVGHANVRISDIAERTGTSTATVHYYFKTKRDVLEATFRYAVEESRRRSEAALDGVDDPWERLVALIDAQLPQGQGRRAWSLWLQLWSEALVDGSLRTLNQEAYRRWADLMESVVRDGQHCRRFRGVDPRDFVIRLLTMMDGLAIQLLMESGELDVEGSHRLLLRFAQDQLGVPQSAQSAVGGGVA